MSNVQGVLPEYHSRLPHWVEATEENITAKHAGRITAFLWSGTGSPPGVGEVVEINFNNFGSATVMRYFTEGPQVGLVVHLHDAPDWHRKQNYGDPKALVFGCEITPAKERR